MAERVYKVKNNGTSVVPSMDDPAINGVSNDAPSFNTGVYQPVQREEAITQPVTKERTYKVNKVAQEQVKLNHLQGWAGDVSVFSEDVNAYFDAINNGEIPTDASYNEMLTRIDDYLSSAEEHRSLLQNNADALSSIEAVQAYLYEVRNEVQKYKDGIAAVLQAEMQESVAASRKETAFKQYGQIPVEAKIHVNNVRTENAFKNLKNYNAANNDMTNIDNAAAMGASVLTGSLQFGHGVYQGLDWLVPDDEVAKLFGLENRVGQFFDNQDDTMNDVYAWRDRVSANATDAYRSLGEKVITPAVAAVPHLLLAKYTGGASLAVTKGSVVTTAVQELVKNPGFWLSFLEIGGSAYKNAITSGATELEAQAVAWLTAFPSAAVEMSGGIQKIPTTEAGVRAFVKNALEEGGEEVVQGVIEQLARATVFEQEKQWFHATDPDAIFSTDRMLQEFLGGVTVAMVLNGGTKATRYAYQSYQYAQLGQQYIKGRGGVTITDAINIGLDNAKGTDTYEAAVQIQEQVRTGETPSPYMVGRMVAESRNADARVARAIEKGVLDSAQALDIETEAAETVAAAAVALGQKVEFVSPEQMHNRYMAGEYVGETDTVRLNAAELDTNKLISAVLAHEMVHAAEGTRQLQVLEKTVRRMIGTERWNNLKAQTKQNYAAHGAQAVGDGTNEALAGWITQNLFRNKGFAEAVVNGDANVGNAFFYLIDRARRALATQKENPSARDLAMLERLFMQAIDARTHTGKEGVQGALNGAPVIDLSDHSELAKQVEGVYGAKKYIIIQNYILEVLGDQPIQLSDGKTAIVDKKDALHIAHNAASKKTAEIAEIKQLVEKAVLYAEDVNPTHNKFNYFCYYKSDVKYDGEVFPLYLNVGRAINTGEYHLYDITNKTRDTADRINGLERPKPNEGYALTNGVSDTNVAQNATDVNTQSMPEGAGIYSHGVQDGVQDGVQGALLSEESVAAVDNGTWRDIRAKRNAQTAVEEDTTSYAIEPGVDADVATQDPGKQSFAADLSKYSVKERATVRRAMESGILNNTPATHAFVDWIARISAEKGIVFQFTNNEKLAASGFAVDGKHVNGLTTAEGILLNVESAKAYQSVVGHELTHVLSDSHLYKELSYAVKRYARAKGEYSTRYKQTQATYAGTDADVEAELIADLVGEYLFTDSEFVSSLSVEHRNLFLTILDEVRYLIKLATAGTKEARALLQLQHTFEELYRTGTATMTDRDGGLQLRSAVEETAELIALHNMTPAELAEALERGGVAMPSVAVVRDNDFSKFGDITVILDKSIIDPAVNANNKLWGADAWTPQRKDIKENIEFNEKETYRIVRDLRAAIGAEHVQELLPMTAKQFRQAIVKAGGSVVGAFSYDDGVRTAYALQQKLLDKIPTDPDGKVNRAALEEQVAERLHTDARWRAFRQWLNGVSDAVIAKYDVPTNEAILNNMRAQPATNKRFRLTESGELTVPSVEYESLDDMRRNKHRITADAAGATRQVATNMLEWANRIGSRYGVDTKAVVRGINKAYDSRLDVEEIAKAMQNHGITITEAEATELQNLYRNAVELPTEYFEAKPGEFVQMDAVAVLVIPNNLDADLKAALAEKNIRTVEYDPNVEGDRQRAVNQFEEYRFSLSSDTETDTAYHSEMMFGNSTRQRSTASTPSVDSAAVLESAVQKTQEGRKMVNVQPRNVGSAKQGRYDAAAAIDQLTAELGADEVLRRMYNATQMNRPTGMVEVDGRMVDANAYIDAYEQSLPSDATALEQTVRRLEQERAAEIARMQQEGTLEDHTFGGLKIDLQLFAAKRKWDLLQLDAGENGTEVRQFYEKRLRGTDANHSDELVELLSGRSETYNPIANEKTLDRAKEKLRRNAKYKDKLLQRIGRYNPRDLFNAQEVAAATVLINDAINDGDFGVAADLIIGLSRKGTEAGRAVQAFSMMARMTPEGTLKAAVRTLQADADYVVGEGADDGMNVLADDLVRAIAEAEEEGLSPEEISERIRNGDVRATSDGVADTGDDASANPTASVEGATREQLMDALTEDLAATEGNYLSKEQIGELLEKTVHDATNIPEQLKRYVLKKIRKDDGGLAQRIYEVYRKGHLTDATMRRALEAALELPTLSDADVEWVVNKATEIQSLEADPIQQAEAMEELYDYLGAKLSVNGLDRLQSWRKFGMLTNVKTHLRNVLSNAAYMGLRKADSAVAMGLERLLVRDADKRSAALGWRHTKHGQSIMPALKERAELAVLEMQKKGAKYEQGVGQLKQKRKFFGLSKVGEMLNSANRWNSDWLEREDVWFFKPAYIDALGQAMTARGVTEITPELHSIAMQRALESTFRADNAISDIFSSLKRFQNETTIGKRLFGHAWDVVIPFHKTPANIATQTIMHSPVGIAVGAVEFYNATRGKGSKDVATAINAMSKGITGSALLAIGLLLGQAGLFNVGFGKSDKERDADELAGLQDGAFVIAGVSVSMDWLQPAASPLIVGASIGERMSEGDLNIAGVFGAVMDGTDSLFELTMLQSLYDILGGYDAGASATLASVVENVVSQSIPTVVGQLARAIDPVQRKTKGDTGFETIINQVVAKIPGLTYLLDPELDVWGNEVYRTGKPTAGTAALNAAQQVVLPANIKVGTGKGDPISEEILRLYQEYGNKAIPSTVSRNDAVEMELDYVEVNKLLGGVNRLAVEEFINNQKPYDVQVPTGNLTASGNPQTKTVTKYYRDMTDAERCNVLANQIYKNSKSATVGDASEKTEEQLNDKERYFRDLLRRVQSGDRGTFGEKVEEPAAEDNTYYNDLLRRMQNGN